MTIKDVEYEEDKESFPAEAYRTNVKEWRGIAFRVLGWERIMDRFGEMEQIGRTGFVAIHMVGDNRVYLVEPKDLTPLKDAEFCTSCGQIGCGHSNV